MVRMMSAGVDDAAADARTSEVGAVPAEEVWSIYYGVGDWLGWGLLVISRASAVHYILHRVLNQQSGSNNVHDHKQASDRIRLQEYST